MAWLEWQGEDGLPRRLRLSEGAALIGRQPDQDVQLRIKGVSRSHARVSRIDGSWYVEDLGSTNGTWRDGLRLMRPMPLRDGERFLIETVEFTFREDAQGTSTVTVEVNSGQVESAVQVRVPQGSGSFRPVGEVLDEEQLRSDYEKLRIANELSRSLAAEFDTMRLLEAVVDQAFRLFKADRAAILLADEAGALHPAVFRVRGEEEPSPFRLSSTILREVVEERTGVLSTDAMADERFQQAQSIMMQGIRATMCVPLCSGDRLHGVIALDSRLRGEVFTRRDLLLLSGFAQQVSTMLDHVRLLEARQRDLLARDQLGRLLSPEMVDAVMEGRVEIRPGGELREATVLFADIRGFTGLSEQLPPQDVIALLNHYFDRMVEVVFACGGTLDKFIGDELMAVWGAPIARADHAAAAAEAALRMQEVVGEVNAARAARGSAPIGVGIGLNSGELVAGFIGSRQAMNWTVIGDVVNVAARLCSAAAPGEVLATPSVVPGEGVVSERLGLRQLKGRRGELEVVRLFRG